MSTLAHGGAGASLTRGATLEPLVEHPTHPTELVPRSALKEDIHSKHHSAVAQSRALLDIQGYRTLSIDGSLVSQSFAPTGAPHDGKLPKLSTIVNPSVSIKISDASQAAGVNRSRAASIPARREISPDKGTVQGVKSSRKPIPANWLPIRTGPNLATAQRAKERGEKKASANGSPVEVKTLRGTRSSLDLGRLSGIEGPTFLTKEALAAVDSNVSSSTTAVRSPTKQKLVLRTSSTSPLRSSQNQKLMSGNKISPSKINRLDIETALSIHSRGPSSVATSTGDTVYHDVGGSPVRSSTNSEQSFQTALEAFDDFRHTEQDGNLSCDASADRDDEQVMRASGNVTSATEKSSGSNKASSGRPRLSVQIPATILVGSSSPNTSNPATNSAGSFSPSSASSISRIPRVVASTAGSAHGPTRSSTLKRAKSKKSKRPSKGQRSEPVPRQESVVASTATPRQVRTVNSAGATPITLNDDEMSSRYGEHGIQPGELTSHSPMEHKSKGKSRLESSPSSSQGELVVYQDKHESQQTSRASSASTVKALLMTDDPAMLDTAVIYSRKKSGTSGMLPLSRLQVHPIIVMMAHNLFIGTFHIRNAEDEATTQHTRALTPNSTVAKIPSESAPSDQKIRRTSIQSSHTSDLRPTAEDFVPKFLQTSHLDNASTVADAQTMTISDLTLPKLEELDMYGIPWYYYMYQVQFAYNEGYHYGRSRSPKKWKPRKQRPAQEADQGIGAPGPSRSIDQAKRASKSQEASRADIPPQTPATPPAAQQAQDQPEQPKPSAVEQLEAESAGEGRSSSPFANQMAFISSQVPPHDLTNIQRGTPTDLTTIRNVGSRNAVPNPGNSSHNSSSTLSYRNQGFAPSRRNFNRSDNGLYTHGRRGNVGLPIDTMPFPAPVPPQGRPSSEDVPGPFTYGRAGGGRTDIQYQKFVGNKACGMINVISASECIGGPPCNDCYPDHPMQ